MAKTNILLLNLKLDKQKLFMNFLETGIKLNETCRSHNSSTHNTLHHQVKMNHFFILCELTLGMARIWNQEIPILDPHCQCRYLHPFVRHQILLLDFILVVPPSLLHSIMKHGSSDDNGFSYNFPRVCTRWLMFIHQNHIQSPFCL